MASTGFLAGFLLNLLVLAVADAAALLWSPTASTAGRRPPCMEHGDPELPSEHPVAVSARSPQLSPSRSHDNRTAMKP